MEIQKQAIEGKQESVFSEAPPLTSAAPAGQSKAAGTAPALSRGFSSFRHRNYQLWFGGQLVSVIGTWMQIIAQGWLVYQLSHSEFALGMVGFASAIPVLIVSPWGGVITDVFPKRTLLVITQTAAMLLAFVLAALTFSNLVQVWHILVLAALTGVVNAFDAPARQSFVVDLVGREDMVNAIALNSMMFNGARVIGPAMGGFLLAWLGSSWCFLINVISFLAVIASLLAMQVPPHKALNQLVNPLKQFGQGLVYARNQPEIRGLLLLAVVFSVFGMSYSALLPAFVDQVLHADASGYGIINALVGAGAVFAALYIAYFATTHLRGRLILIANLAYPLVLGVFAFNTGFPVAVFLAFVLGFGFMIQANSMNSLLQLKVDDAMRGRVMGLFTLSFFGLSPFGSLGAGALAEHLPISLTIALMALIMLAGSLIIQRRIPEIRRM
ncbi:MAG: MFS transporter [Anaerolineaceae bacterium]|nr:MFS transporter [Anaerolineaceae bacterium]